MGFFWFVPFWFLMLGLIVMWFLWLLSCLNDQIEVSKRNFWETYVDLDFVFDFSVNVNPVLLVSVDWSKVDVGNIVGLPIAVIAWVAIIALIAFVARLFLNEFEIFFWPWCNSYRVFDGALVNVVSDGARVILEILASWVTSFLILAICLSRFSKWCIETYFCLQVRANSEN